MNTKNNSKGCFVAGTLVHTDKGLVPIEQINVGDRVLSKPENGEGEVAYKPVENTFVHEDKEIWLVEFTMFGLYPDKVIYSREVPPCFDVLVGTPNHPFWVVGELKYYEDMELIMYPKPYWARLDQLQPYAVVLRADGYLARVRVVQPIFIMENPDLGFLHGYPLGDWFDYDAYFDSPYINLSGSPRISEEEVNNKQCVDDSGDWLFPVKTRKVYNFEVADYHTYFVGEAGIWVHNKNCGGEAP